MSVWKSLGFAAFLWTGLLCVMFKLPLFPALPIVPLLVFAKNKEGHPLAEYGASHPNQYWLLIAVLGFQTLRTLYDIYVWIMDGMPIAGVGA